MKWRLSLVTLAVIFLVFTSYLVSSGSSPSYDVGFIKEYRDIPGVTEEEVSAIEALKASREFFTYGCVASTEAFLLPSGERAGFAVKLCELLSGLFDIEFVLQVYDWDTLRSDFDEKTIDFTGALTLSPERMKVYSMTHTIAERPLKLFVRVDSDEIGKEEDINGLKICFLEGSITEESLREYCPMLCFETKNAKNADEAAAMLKSGTVDAVIADGIEELNFEPYEFITSKELFSLIYNPVSLSTANRDLEAVISVMNKYLAAGGDDRLFELYEEGECEYAKHRLENSYNDEETAYLSDLRERNAKVSIALEHDNYPVSFYNGADGEFQGIVPDVLAKISLLTGIEFEVTTAKDTAWAEIIEKLRAGEISMVSQLVYSEDRKEDFIWTDVPYSVSHYALISKLDYPRLTKHQVMRAAVGVVKKTVNEEMYNAWFPDNNNTLRYDTYNEALDALESGEIDLLMASENILLSQTNYREKPGYKVNVPFLVPLESLFGFHKGEAVLCSIINKAQAHVSTDGIVDDWTSRVFNYLRKFDDERLAYTTFFAVVLLIVLIAVIFLFYTNKRIDKKFKRQAATLSTIYKAIPDLLFCIDIHLKYTSCNPSFEKLAGREEAEVIGRNALEVFAFDRRMAEKFLETAKEAMSKNSAVTVEEWITYPDRSRRLFETLNIPLSENGAVVGMMGISRDITEHKKAEDEARAASNAKSAFLAHMSHEIRTPMNAIVGMTELILRDGIPKSAHENAICIQRAGVSMLSIINDILDFSKIEAGKLEINPVEYSFASLINDVMNIFLMRIGEKSISFVVNIDCAIPECLIGDEVRVRQIIFNLLSNAVKYTNEGYVAIDIACELREHTAVLTIEVSDSGVGIEEENLGKLFNDFYQVDTQKQMGVEGTGLGLAITKELCLAMGGDIGVRSEFGVGSIFTASLPQEFSQYRALAKVENPDEKRVLVCEPRQVYLNSIARTLENLGVRCTLVATQSRLDEELMSAPYSFVFVPAFLQGVARRLLDELGLNATLVLMAEYQEAVSSQNVKTVTMPIHAVSIANILNDTADDSGFLESGAIDISFTAPTAKILIVDDVGTNLKVAQGLMSRYQMQIDTCKSGLEAVNLAASNRYDVIFMDHMMPVMDGIEAAGKIRALEDDSGYYQKVPIIAFTANAVSGMKDVFLQNGLNDFLSKPIETSKLNAILEKWIPREMRKRHVEAGMPPAPAMAEIGGVDAKAGVLMTGSLENYVKALAVFCEDGVEKAKEIKESLERNDLKLYTTFMHALKSALKSIGAGKMAESAKILEAAGKKGETAYIAGNTSVFLEELDSLIQNIRVALEKHCDRRQAKGEGDHNAFKEEIAKLRKALVDMDIRLINEIMSGLEAQAWDAGVEDVIRNLSKCILLSEFSEAISLIDRDCG